MTGNTGGGKGGVWASLNLQTKWNYLAKGWHPVDDEMQDRLHMLSYVCQRWWPNSPRRTSVELNRCLVGAVGDGRPLKGSWLTVENQTQWYEKQKVERPEIQKCANVWLSGMSLVAARTKNLLSLLFICDFFLFLFCLFCILDILEIHILESNIWSSFGSIMLHIPALAARGVHYSN